MSILKIASGVVLGIFCWHLILAWSERQDQQARQQYIEQAYKSAMAQCKQGDLKACSEGLELDRLRMEQSVKDMKRFAEP